MNREITDDEYIEFLNTINTLSEKEREIIRRGVLQMNNDKRELLSLIKHYRHLYQDIKKQKDDVVNRIKLLGKFDGTRCTRNFKMMAADFNEILRMLGEIDVKD